MTGRQLRIVRNGEPSPARPCPVEPPAAESLAENTAVHALLERGMRAIVALTGARGGAIRLLAPGLRGLRLIGAMGMSPEAMLEERVVGLDCGICGVALQTGGMQVDHAPQVCARRLDGVAGGRGCGPVLAVPLHCEGRPMGVFNLFFGDSHLPEDLGKLLEPASQLLDTVLDNARLEHERLRSSLRTERQLCASEVHDNLAQGLAYMRMRMPLLQDAIRAGERAHALKYFQDVSDAMGEAHARLRELIAQFRTAVDHGLVHALETIAVTFEDRTGVKLTVESRAPALGLSAEEELQVYQVVQEALANVIKHAGATTARIVVERTSRQVRVTVADDGVGLPRGKPWGQGEHYGMEIMRERAERIGGHFDIKSAPGRGTRVRITVPVRREPEA